jgi:preprotein translocase subunit SecB
MGENHYENVLTITVTAKNDGEVAFLAEVHQAGVFQINGFTEEQLETVLGIFCPTTLFPYAREALSDLITRGGFPQLLLNPVNFEALYAQNQQADQTVN